jgi:pentose-5-phosphate-3-epimerase/putative flippase GtrA
MDGALPELKRRFTRFRRRLKYSFVALQFYRHRYLIGFIVFGFVSILFELALLRVVIPADWRSDLRTAIAFVAGLLLSFFLNAVMNFQVPRRYFLSTFVRFAAVATFSYAINLVLINLVQNELELSYARSRIVCAGVLFLVAYYVHRKLTFRLDRNFGIAVYAAPQENLSRIYFKVGRNCDHIHIDLVDSTFNPTAEVDLSKIERARKIWPNVPFALHLMTRRPDRWLDATLPHVDWVLLSLASDVDIKPLLAQCELARKKVGVVWHLSDPVERLYDFLAHIDFVMVLGIAKPGYSGQSISPQAIAVIQMLERLRNRYHYELMFDGSVNTETVRNIPARYLVAASSVLKADNPAKVISILKSGAKRERSAA